MSYFTLPYVLPYLKSYLTLPYLASSHYRVARYTDIWHFWKTCTDFVQILIHVRIYTNFLCFCTDKNKFFLQFFYHEFEILKFCEKLGIFHILWEVELLTAFLFWTNWNYRQRRMERFPSIRSIKSVLAPWNGVRNYAIYHVIYFVSGWCKKLHSIGSYKNNFMMNDMTNRDFQVSSVTSTIYIHSFYKIKFKKKNKKKQIEMQNMISSSPYTLWNTESNCKWWSFFFGLLSECKNGAYGHARSFHTCGNFWNIRKTDFSSFSPGNPATLQHPWQELTGRHFFSVKFTYVDTKEM